MSTVFRATFKSVETDKEIAYYITTADEPDSWEKALQCARDNEQKSDVLLLIKLEYLGAVYCRWGGNGKDQ